MSLVNGMKKGDFVVIVGALLLALFVFLQTGITDTFDHKYLSIQVDGEEIARYEYDDHTKKDIPVQSKFGYDLVRIADGKVRIVEADCRDGLCIKQGTIEEPGETIICLPNRLVVEIVGSNGDLDTVNY